ncbi:MAG: glycosyltransferase, partial [Deltaproteobacteria bacterium]|nr:glycosyltransferase [Deltaproteobacteria bacterium]
MALPGPPSGDPGGGQPDPGRARRAGLAAGVITSVSVSIPTYNPVDRVATAGASVINQSFQETEILGVEDGSSDEPAEALEPFLDRIRILR